MSGNKVEATSRVSAEDVKRVLLEITKTYPEVVANAMTTLNMYDVSLHDMITELKKVANGLDEPDRWRCDCSEEEGCGSIHPNSLAKCCFCGKSNPLWLQYNLCEEDFFPPGLSYYLDCDLGTIAKKLGITGCVNPKEELPGDSLPWVCQWTDAEKKKLLDEELDQMVEERSKVPCLENSYTLQHIDLLPGPRLELMADTCDYEDAVDRILDFSKRKFQIELNPNSVRKALKNFGTSARVVFFRDGEELYLSLLSS
jgi:hypothetical protein